MGRPNYTEDIMELGRPSCNDNIIVFGSPITYYMIKETDGLELPKEDFNCVRSLELTINKIIFQRIQPNKISHGMYVRLWDKINAANPGHQRHNITGLGRPSCKDNIVGLGRPIMHHMIMETGCLCLATAF